jgi:predicted nuclease of predicted toxin-antitoxin system
MKLLFDENLSAELCAGVADLFPGSSQVRLMGLAQANDNAIWERAKAGGFASVSLDADFADMAALYGAPPKVIWLRCGNQPSAAIGNLLREHAEAIASFEQDDASCLEIYPKG